MQSNIAQPISDSNATLNMTTDTGRDLPPEAETAQDGRIREIVKDNVDVKNLVIGFYTCKVYYVCLFINIKEVE